MVLSCATQGVVESTAGQYLPFSDLKSRRNSWLENTINFALQDLYSSRIFEQANLVLNMSTGGVESGVSLHEELLNMESLTWDALKQSGKALAPFLTADW